MILKMTGKKEKIKEKFEDFMQKMRSTIDIPVSKELETLFLMAYAKGWKDGEEDATGNVALVQ